MTPLDDLWVLNLATRRWTVVQAEVAGVGGPGARVMAAMALPSRQSGLKAPVVLFGGADLTCLAQVRSPLTCSPLTYLPPAVTLGHHLPHMPLTHMPLTWSLLTCLPLLAMFGGTNLTR